MARWAVGDVQGCCIELEQLLARIRFSSDCDRLWLVGDLVNRGPASLAVLRLVRDLGRAASSLVADLGLLLCVSGRALAQEQWRQVFATEAFDEDLGASLADGTLLRERFHRTAQTGLMILRNPLGARRKVGGSAPLSCTLKLPLPLTRSSVDAMAES